MFVLTACAAKKPFLYQYPVQVEQPAAGMKLACTCIKDRRQDHEIDKIYAENLTEDLNRIIEKEIQSMGLCKQVISIPRAEKVDKALKENPDIDLVMYTSLKELVWEVPDYDRKVGTVFVLSFLTGGLGGVAYGSTKTDVYGNARIKITVIRTETGEKLIDKEYVGHIEERMALLKCDTPNTKARIVGLSVKSIMKQFKGDLKRVIKSMRP
jgi:hypothetical protein